MKEKNNNSCVKENCFVCPVAKAALIDGDIVLVCRKRKFIKFFIDECKDFEENFNVVLSSK